MQKTPDEIKKGLAYCDSSDHMYNGCAGGCPYWDESYGCGSGDMKIDALALIQQLQDENAEKDAKIQQLEADKQQLEGMLTHMNQLRDAAAGRALKMEERVHQFEAERDAAVDALTKIIQKHDESFCEYCDNWDRYTCPPSCRTYCERFSWRGVQKEE